MEVRFDIKEFGYTKIGDLWFKIDGNKTDKRNEFLLEIKPPDLDDWSDIIGYYFVYETINEYEGKNKYTEYVNCFEEIANKLCTEKDLYLFNLNINKEFKDVDKELLKNCFEEIANKLCTEKDLYLFNLNINKEFKDVDKELLKNYFLEINEIIINKVKMCFKYHLKENSDDKNNSDNESDDENNSDNESNESCD